VEMVKLDESCGFGGGPASSPVASAEGPDAVRVLVGNYVDRQRRRRSTTEDRRPPDGVTRCRRDLSISSLPPRQTTVINYLTVAVVVDVCRIPAGLAAAAADAERESDGRRRPGRDVPGRADVGAAQLAQPRRDARLLDSTGLRRRRDIVPEYRDAVTQLRRRHRRPQYRQQFTTSP